MTDVCVNQQVRFEALPYHWLISCTTLVSCSDVEAHLYTNLMSNYSKLIRPAEDPHDVVNVNMSLSLVQLLSVDDKSQVITVSIWLYQIWYDYRLKWNSSEYGDIDYILVRGKDLWYPDTSLYQSAEESPEQYPYVITDWFLLRVYSTGKVFVQSPHTWKIPCNVDVTSFPNDHQHCAISVGMWSHTARQVDYEPIFDTIKKELYIPSNSWEVSGSGVTKGYSYDIHSGGPYAYIDFTLYLDRKPLFYLLNLCIPSVLLSLLMSLVFCFPPDSPDKIPHGLSVLLTIFIFDILVIDIMPASSDNIPITSQYLFVNMVLTVVAIILSALLINMHKLKGNFSGRRKKVLLFIAWLLKVSYHDTNARWKLLKETSNPSLGTRLKDYNKIVQTENIDLSNAELKTFLPNGDNMFVKENGIGLHRHPALLRDVKSIKRKIVEIQNKLDTNLANQAGVKELESDWKTLAAVLNRTFFISLLSMNVGLSMWILIIGLFPHNDE
ncbi:acetylcholine receptor subunit alpha-like [Glandiceps talaboti]